MSDPHDAAERVADNPFFVLGLPPDAAARDVEREAQKLIGMLELGLAEAMTYATPLGPRPRTTERVRAAAAVLRDPRRRLVAELWAARGPAAVTGGPAAVTGGSDAGAAASPSPAGWVGALAIGGWGPRRHPRLQPRPDDDREGHT